MPLCSIYNYSLVRNLNIQVVPHHIPRALSNQRLMNSTEKWWNSGTTAVVTGSNKGIGFEIARMLAEHGLRTVVTARSEQKGIEATQKLEQALENRQDAGTLLFHQLDITDRDSIDRFAVWAAEKLQHVDILVNNAGMAFKGNTFGAQEARSTMGTNFYGTADFCQKLRPLLSPGARIVNVCSGSGKLSIIPNVEVRSKLEKATSFEEVSGVAEGFLNAIEQGTHQWDGWPGSMYGMSKACEAAYTRALARELQDRGIMVNACCPGWCATDMSSWKGPRSAAQGADTPVWLALLPPEPLVTGGFFRDRKEEGF